MREPASRDNGSDGSGEEAAGAEGLRAAFRRFRTQRGEDLLTLSERSPVLVALLRHTGCPFCQEAMRDLASSRGAIESRGVRIVVVFQAPEGEFAERFFEQAGLPGVDRIADPERALYRALDVRRGGVWQIFGPHVLVRVVRAVASGVRPGKRVGGDAMQLPGTVLIQDGKIVRRHVHRSQADRANYEEVACAV